MNAHVLTFDTLKYANTLKAAGFSQMQAEAQAEALSDVLEINLKELATKGDLAALKSDLVAMEQRIDAKLIQLEQRMTIKLGTMMVVAVGVAATLVKLL
jgi:translation elongation factor EF-1alpha